MISGHRNFIRAIKARCFNDAGAAEYAERRWGPQSGALALLQRAATGALGSGDFTSSGGLGDVQFWQSVVDASVTGRLAGLRWVPFNVRLLAMVTPARGYWITEGSAIGLSKQVLTGSTLPRKKVGVVGVFTKESFESQQPSVEQDVETDLRNAFVGSLDEGFLDVNNAGILNTMPAAVTYNATSTTSGGKPATDVAWLIENFAGDLSAAYLITDPTTAAQLALARDAVGGAMFPDAGPRGGSVLGIPLLTSRNSPRDSDGGQLVLIDPSGVAFASDSLEVSRSLNANLEMDDTPDGAALTPTGTSKAVVNLFQADAVALKGVLSANWERQRAGCVAVITGASYATAPAP